jgi:hypothetical protein
MTGAFNGRVESGFILDACHDELAPGDVFIVDYRDQGPTEFTVLYDRGGGLWQFRTPDGDRPMRPSTILNVGTRKR